MAAPIAQDATIASRSIQDASHVMSRSESTMIHDLSRRAAVPKSKKELVALVMKMLKSVKPKPSSAKKGSKAAAAKKARSLDTSISGVEERSELFDLVTRTAGDPKPSIMALAQTFLDAVKESGEDQAKWTVIMLKAGWQFTTQGNTLGWLHGETQGFYTQAKVAEEVAKLRMSEVVFEISYFYPFVIEQ
ncbi:hypothetical protein C8J56DRAFT_1066521 [Mycena floridula]|nr:hypothetical protein C8J56DRAFT_1066521 [Mycena floridula]